MRTCILVLFPIYFLVQRITLAQDNNPIAGLSRPAVDFVHSERVTKGGTEVSSEPLDSVAGQLPDVQRSIFFSEDEDARWTLEMNRIGLDLNRAAMAVGQAYSIARDRMPFHRLDGPATLTPNEFNRWSAAMQRLGLDLGRAAFATGIALELWAGREMRRNATDRALGLDSAAYRLRTALGHTAGHQDDSKVAATQSVDTPPNTDDSGSELRKGSAKFDIPKISRVDLSGSIARARGGSSASSHTARLRADQSMADWAALSASVKAVRAEIIAEQNRRRAVFRIWTAGAVVVSLTGIAVWCCCQGFRQRVLSAAVARLQRATIEGG